MQLSPGPACSSGCSAPSHLAHIGLVLSAVQRLLGFSDYMRAWLTFKSRRHMSCDTFKSQIPCLFPWAHCKSNFTTTSQFWQSSLCSVYWDSVHLVPFFLVEDRFMVLFILPFFSNHYSASSEPWSSELALHSCHATHNRPRWRSPWYRPSRSAIIFVSWVMHMPNQPS